MPPNTSLKIDENENSIKERGTCVIDIYFVHVYFVYVYFELCPSYACSSIYICFEVYSSRRRSPRHPSVYSSIPVFTYDWHKHTAVAHADHAISEHAYISVLYEYFFFMYVCMYESSRKHIIQQQ